MTNRVSLINPELTLLLAYCAYEAYYPTRHTPPQGYHYKGQWTGRNPSFFGGDVEPYGLIFQGNTPSTSGDYIFAFKGTASWWDAYEDLFIHQIPFTAYHNSNPENQVKVAEGFMDVYSAPVTIGGKDSMQNQLFQMISALNPNKITITGHSLGSALAELFTLDLYISLKTLPFHIEHYNFACPRVGSLEFAQLYRLVEQNNPPDTRTIRVVNYWDEIPCLPFEDLGYAHGPDYFLCSFFKKTNWPHLPNYGVRHSIYNYWQVLKKVMANSKQVYSGEVTGLNGIRLQSTILDSSTTECSFALADELMEVALRKKANSHQ